MYKSPYGLYNIQIKRKAEPSSRPKVVVSLPSSIQWLLSAAIMTIQTEIILTNACMILFSSSLQMHSQGFNKSSFNYVSPYGVHYLMANGKMEGVSRRSAAVPVFNKRLHLAETESMLKMTPKGSVEDTAEEFCLDDFNDDNYEVVISTQRPHKEVSLEQLYLNVNDDVNQVRNPSRKSSPNRVRGPEDDSLSETANIDTDVGDEICDENSSVAEVRVRARAGAGVIVMKPCAHRICILREMKTDAALVLRDDSQREGHRRETDQSICTLYCFKCRCVRYIFSPRSSFSSSFPLPLFSLSSHSPLFSSPPPISVFSIFPVLTCRSSFPHSVEFLSFLLLQVDFARSLKKKVTPEHSHCHCCHCHCCHVKAALSSDTQWSSHSQRKVTHHTYLKCCSFFPLRSSRHWTATPSLRWTLTTSQTTSGRSPWWICSRRRTRTYQRSTSHTTAHSDALWSDDPGSLLGILISWRGILTRLRWYEMKIQILI